MVSTGFTGCMGCMDAEASLSSGSGHAYLWILKFAASASDRSKASSARSSVRSIWRRSSVPSPDDDAHAVRSLASSDKIFMHRDQQCVSHEL